MVRLILLSFYFYFIIRMVIITWRVLKFDTGHTEWLVIMCNILCIFTFSVSGRKHTKGKTNIKWKSS